MVRLKQMVPHSVNRTVAPTSEPVTVAEAKKHVEILDSDTTHDNAMSEFIKSAREQLEHDTGYTLMSQTYTQSFHSFPVEGFFYLKVRPVQSVTSITYYDSSNAQQTLATTVYGVDTARRMIYLKYNQSWPSITQQHNGIVVTMVGGYSSADAVPSLLKQAILLQVGKWFEHRDMTEPTGYTHDQAYKNIVRKIMTPHHGIV